MSNLNNKSIFVCDGSCVKNPGPGGWAYARVDGDNIDYRHGFSADTTNNIMELTAVIEAIRDGAELIYTDSNYVVQGLNKWIIAWKRSGWKTADKKPVKNVELWKILDDLMRTKRITIRWIKGHATPDDYEDQQEKMLISVQINVDKLAFSAARGLLK